MWGNLIYKLQAHQLGHPDHSCSIRRPLKGQGKWPLLRLLYDLPSLMDCFFSFLLCLFSCMRPHGICHLSSVKFSCKVSQCVFSRTSMRSSQDAARSHFQKSINMLVSQEGSGSLCVKAHPFLDNRYEAGYLLEAEAPDKLHLLWWQHLRWQLPLETQDLFLDQAIDYLLPPVNLASIRIWLLDTLHRAVEGTWPASNSIPPVWELLPGILYWTTKL